MVTYDPEQINRAVDLVALAGGDTRLRRVAADEHAGIASQVGHTHAVAEHGPPAEGAGGVYGDNAHHVAESCFKGLARALRAALAIDPRRANEIPSTKGVL